MHACRSLGRKNIKINHLGHQNDVLKSVNLNSEDNFNMQKIARNFCPWDRSAYKIQDQVTELKESTMRTRRK